MRQLKIVTWGCGLLLLLACLMMVWNTALAVQEKKISLRNAFVSFIQAQKKPDSIYFFSQWPTPAHPLVDYAKVKYASRFSCFRFLLGLQCYLQQPLSLSQRQAALAARQFFIIAVTEDFLKAKPDLVFVEQGNAYWQRANVKGYIEFFSQAPQFKKLWLGYGYVGRLGQYVIYKKL